MSKQQANLALPSIERQALEDAKPAQVETWNYTVRNSIMYVPEGTSHFQSFNHTWPVN